MEKLSPPLEWSMCIRTCLEAGMSMSMALDRALEENKDEFTPYARQLLESDRMGAQLKLPGRSNLSSYRYCLLQILQKGLSGEPVLPSLREFEEECIVICTQEVEQFAAVLPVRVLLIVLLLQFPAFLLIVLAPLLIAFLEGF